MTTTAGGELTSDYGRKRHDSSDSDDRRPARRNDDYEERRDTRERPRDYDRPRHYGRDRDYDRHRDSDRYHDRRRDYGRDNDEPDRYRGGDFRGALVRKNSDQHRDEPPRAAERIRDSDSKSES